MSKNKKIAIVILGGLTAAKQKVIDAFLAEQKDLEHEIVDFSELEKELSTKAGLITQLESDKSALEALKAGHIEEIAQKNKDIAVLDTVIAGLTEQNEKLSVELTALSTELSTVQNAADKGYKTVKSGKKTYRVYGKSFHFNNKKYSVEDLQKNQSLVDHLVSIGSGLLVEEKVKEG